ncbi:hypothetical protein TEA_014849 [Camellia sinensis var. sinensis]|uniref:ABC transporter domain-containing protein n=1 Tax=Camellia sinensis var. sinensis TaxID=542762 RepID=A0A4V3WIU4_CAMSN|nr:hypothetical protein TEA_014849 [Camellia sinensis var. sinensis]
MLYEFSKYALQGSDTNAGGMKWKDLNDSTNGMKELLIIMVVECRNVTLMNLCTVLYLVMVSVDFGSGFSHSHDVLHREKVEQLLTEPGPNYAIVCDDLKKVYPAVDGNPRRLAVRGLSLALPRGECFDLALYKILDNIEPSFIGSFKSLFFSYNIRNRLGLLTYPCRQMIGLTEPSSGTAYVQGLNMSTDMDRIYTSMGVCPQHDLLWETLTAREHLLFYGRLKNLKASTGLWEVSNCMKKLVTEKSGVLGLHTGESKRGEGEMSEQGKYVQFQGLGFLVEESLNGVNLHSGGVADKEAGKYSGGMKRRLSVAISLIGDPKVVYMDEPSTGLDPASRNELWNAVMKAKRDRAILLTTHSMEEAEHLCDRLGIFVDGSLQCVGNAKQVVYMDEPSTGLDPASRNELWNVVMKAKRDRAILLTTHSMEEVEHLCDRLGIFVDGSLQCVGNAKQLKARYGGSYVFTITTPSNYEQEVDSMVRRLFLSANKTYHISGTQKFELPKHEVRIADVFQAVDNAKNRFTVQAWGFVDTTLEDVFIKVSCGV